MNSNRLTLTQMQTLVAKKVVGRARSPEPFNCLALNYLQTSALVNELQIRINELPEGCHFQIIVSNEASTNTDWFTFTIHFFIAEAKVNALIIDPANSNSLYKFLHLFSKPSEKLKLYYFKDVKEPREIAFEYAPTLALRIATQLSMLPAEALFKQVKAHSTKKRDCSHQHYFTQKDFSNLPLLQAVFRTMFLNEEALAKQSHIYTLNLLDYDTAVPKQVSRTEFFNALKQQSPVPENLRTAWHEATTSPPSSRASTSALKAFGTFKVSAKIENDQLKLKFKCNL